MTQTIIILDNHFTLHPGGAVFWHEQNMLLIADVHLGKVTHFRKYGAAVPAQASLSNLEKLKKVVTEFQPETVCFLGDLFHSKLNSEWDIFAAWVAASSCKVVLITGNHDILPQYLFEDLGIAIFTTRELQGFLLTHHPQEERVLFNFCGHVHPGIKMQGAGRQQVKLACFYKSNNQMILPAFGAFTGKFLLKPTEKDEIYAIVEHEVICVSGK